MITRNIIKILTGAAAVYSQANSNLVEKGSNFVEDNLLRGKYVSREEFEQLKYIVTQLQQQVTDATKKDKGKKDTK